MDIGIFPSQDFCTSGQSSFCWSKGSIPAFLGPLTIDAEVHGFGQVDTLFIRVKADAVLVANFLSLAILSQIEGRFLGRKGDLPNIPAIPNECVTAITTPSQGIVEGLDHVVVVFYIHKGNRKHLREVAVGFGSDVVHVKMAILTIE